MTLCVKVKQQAEGRRVEGRTGVDLFWITSFMLRTPDAFTGFFFFVQRYMKHQVKQGGS